MKANKLIVGLMLISASLIISSCAKDGETGPAGKDGNANVQSILLNATSSSWGFDNTYKWSSATWTGVSILTSSTINSGAMMLYEGGSGNWLAVPYTFSIGTTGISFNSFYEVIPNSITVYNQLSDGSNPSPGAVQYRLVCIPPAGLAAHPEVDLKNYEQVAKAFDLK